MNAKSWAARFKRAGEGAGPVTGPAGETGGAVKPAAPGDAAAPAGEDGAAKVTSDAAADEGTEKAPATAASRTARLVEGARFRTGRRVADAATQVLGTSELARRLKPASVPVAAAASLLLALGAGYGLGLRGSADASGGAVVRTEMTRLAGELTGVKAALDAGKGEREKGRAEILARQAQLSDKLDRLGQEVGTKVGRAGEQAEKTQRDLARIASLSDRIEKLERAGATPAAPPTPPAKPVAAAAPLDVKETGSIEPKPAPDPRKTPVEGYFVRDYDEGFALVETKAGRYIEVAVGYTVPGIGRVEAIERRGRQWVVVTPKGYIGER